MDKCYYKDFIEDEKQFYLHEAGFDGREEQLFRLRVYDGKTLEEAAEIMLVTLENKGDEVLELTPVTAVPIYGRGADHLRDNRHVTSLLNRIQIKEDGILVTPSMAFDERGHH